LCIYLYALHSWQLTFHCISCIECEHVLNILLIAFTYACPPISLFLTSSTFRCVPRCCRFRIRHSQSETRIRFWSFFIRANSTRHFRSHWIKGKSKLNCPKAAAEIYDLFVLSDQTQYSPISLPLYLSLSFSLSLSQYSPGREFVRPFICPQTSAPVKWLCGRLYITHSQRKPTTERSERGESINKGYPMGVQWHCRLILARICIAALVCPLDFWPLIVVAAWMLNAHLFSSPLTLTEYSWLFYWAAASFTKFPLSLFTERERGRESAVFSSFADKFIHFHLSQISVCLAARAMPHILLLIDIILYSSICLEILPFIIIIWLQPLDVDFGQPNTLRIRNIAFIRLL